MTEFIFPDNMHNNKTTISESSAILKSTPSLDGIHQTPRTYGQKASCFLLYNYASFHVIQ